MRERGSNRLVGLQRRAGELQSHVPVVDRWHRQEHQRGGREFSHLLLEPIQAIGGNDLLHWVRGPQGDGEAGRFGMSLGCLIEGVASDCPLHGG